MYSHTIAVLEKFDNQHDFERMAADILNASGYKNVVPIAPRGGSDGGMDIKFSTDDGKRGLACVTLRKDIDSKFKEDFSKRSAGEFDLYILFCTACLTASQKSQFAQYCLDTLQAAFVPHDIEALRSLLDSALQQIKEKYLPSTTFSERFNLSIRLRQEAPPNINEIRDSNTTLLAFSISNGGSQPAYISSIGLEALIDGISRTIVCEISRRAFPTNLYVKEEAPVLPGQCHTYLVHAPRLSTQLQACGENIVLQKAYVEDEIGKTYTCAVPPDVASWLISFSPAKKYPYSLL